MKFLYVIGGQQKYLRPFLADDANWYEYHKGVILLIDPAGQTSELMVEYTSPPEARAEHGVATLFKSGTIHGDRLYVCTQTEVLVYKVPSFSKVAYISLPCFNDVHHVRPTHDGNLVVASAGLDMVLEMTIDGEILREWNTLGHSPWSYFSRDVDYRQLSTKPHKSHPNFLFYVDDELWATRFYQRDAISLSDPSRRIEIGLGTPHDGLVNGDYVYFTTVNGNVVVVNKATLKTEEVLDLNTIHNYGGPLGWCRGVLVQGEKIWVGFSRIRPTKLRENVEWVKRSLKSKVRPLLPAKYQGKNKWMRGMARELPSHLACYDLRNRKCLSEINLEPHGISAVFSIFPASITPVNSVAPKIPVTLSPN
jgi:hypothetical protein